MDLTGVRASAVMLADLDAARLFIAGQPKKRTLRVLINLVDARYDSELVEAFKRLAVHNKPWVLASAVAGIDGFWRVGLRIVSLFAGRKIAGFKDPEKAKDWLISQELPPTEVPVELD